MNTQPECSELGKATSYDNSYDPSKLFPIPRAAKRLEIGVDPNHIPFKGYDCWNHYEVSWLNAKGKPEVAVAEIVYDCSSPNIIESKSMKLYFNTLNGTQFDSKDALQACVRQDLSQAVGAEVTVDLYHLNQAPCSLSSQLLGECLDGLDVACNEYTVNPSYLGVDAEQAEETLYSNLLKSNCLVTHQPDWGSVQITYTGQKINHEGLLKYIVSFREHNEFHEQCIERIFMDIMQHCKPEKLAVLGRYTRRGGLDINPYRSTEPFSVSNQRLIRQ